MTETEPRLFKVAGTIMGVGKAETFPQRTYYESVWLRESDERQTTIHKLGAAQSLSRHLVVGETVTLYLVPSPSGHKFLFAIDAGTEQADVIDSIGSDQRTALRAALKWLALGIPGGLALTGLFVLVLSMGWAIKWLFFVILVILTVVGVVLVALTVRALILLARAPRPAEMRAFLAGHRAAPP